MLQLLSKRLTYGVRYSRFYLEDQARDRIAQSRALAQQNQKKRLQNVFNIPSNDANEKNRIKVRMNHNLFSVNPKKDHLKTHCWILQPQPIEYKPKVTISAIRKYIITSIKKAREALIIVRKRHIFQAIHLLQKSHKKVAKLMVRTFYNLIDHAGQKGLNPMRLWVHGCIIGKTKRYKSVRYHAKGRGCREKKDFCQVRVILYEKPEKQYFEEIATGEGAAGVAAVVRHFLKLEKADYEKVSKFTGVTTARGRQQAKMIFKRKIDRVMLQNQEQGKYQPRKIIEARLKEQQGQKMKQKFRLLRNDQLSDLKLRERQFKKNMEN